MSEGNLKPLKRTKIRVSVGKIFYTFKRYLEWFLGGKKFARKASRTLLPYVIFKHQTPLLRKLKDADMWLQHNKIKNLKLAVPRISGVIISPGETFSYWRLIGKATRRKGYIEGMVLSHGSFSPGIGGGLCQLSNLIYWMTLHTPLTVTERHRHSYDVFPDVNRTQPFGSGATCAYNYLDLQIYNGTNIPYQLNVYLTDTHLVGEWRAGFEAMETFEVYEKDHWISHEPWGGYVRHNSIFRKGYNRNKELLKDEFIAENHAIMMYQPYLSEGMSHEEQC
ncbi:MAG: VanW family protein [Bacillota bacterium]